MKLIHSQALLDLSSFKRLPSGTYRRLFVRYAGTSAAGKTMTRTNLGRVRLNRNGTDEVNATADQLLFQNDLRGGVAEFSAAIGAAFSGSFYIYRHAHWDDFGGEYYGTDEAYIELSFPALTAVEIASGNVEIYSLDAESPAQYIFRSLQRNIQAGGAGQAVQEIEIDNISSLLVTEAAAVSKVQVTTDGIERVNGSQVALKAASNNSNKVETAIAQYELNLNVFNKIIPNMNKRTKVQFDVTAAVNIDILTESFLFDLRMTEESVRPRPKIMPVPVVTE